MERIFLILLFCWVSNSAFAEGIEFFKGSWEEAKEKALTEDKVIFVDAYTTWCGPCKRMAKSVFPNKEVGEVFNKHFISLKIDMEKGEGPKFAREYGVRSYPTLLWIDGSGELVHRAVGAKQPADFVKIGEMVARKTDKSIDLAEQYERGNRDPEFLMRYVSALNNAGKPSLKIANEYLKTQKDLTTDFNLKFIKEAVSEADSRIFDMLIKNKSKIIDITSKEDVDGKIKKACSKTLLKAIEYESEDLLIEAKEKIKHLSDQKAAAKFGTDADLKYYLTTGNTKQYFKVANTYIKKSVSKNPEEIHRIAALTYEKLPTDKKAMEYAETWAQKAFKLEKTYDYAMTLAGLMYLNGNTKKALSVVDNAISLAEKENKPSGNAQALKQKINLDLSK